MHMMLTSIVWYLCPVYLYSLYNDHECLYISFTNISPWPTPFSSRDHMNCLASQLSQTLSLFQRCQQNVPIAIRASLRCDLRDWIRKFSTKLQNHATEEVLRTDEIEELIRFDRSKKLLLLCGEWTSERSNLVIILASSQSQPPYCATRPPVHFVPLSVGDVGNPQEDLQWEDHHACPLCHGELGTN